MQTLTINILNPKAEKLINDLADLDLISIESNTSYKWYDDEEFVEELNEDIVNYNKGNLETHTLEDVKTEIENRLKNK